MDNPIMARNILVAVIICGLIAIFFLTIITILVVKAIKRHIERKKVSEMVKQNKEN